LALWRRTEQKFGIGYLSTFVPARHYEFGGGFINEHLYFYRALAMCRRVSNSATTPMRNVMCNNMKPLKFILVVLILSLKSYGQTNIQVIIKNVSNHKIDNVDIFDLSQKEFLETQYKDTLNFAFTKKNVDCYNIRYHENGKMFRQQIWLDSGQLKIEAHIDSSALIIDSVFNSPTYYKYLNFRSDFSILSIKKDTSAMNNILLELYSDNIDNPYSLLFAETYLRLNQNSKASLSKLKLLTDKQGDKFNWFLLYPLVVERLNNILTVSSINLNDYSFINRQNKIVKFPILTKKYYILDFWFLACAPCIQDHKEILNGLKILENKNAEVISISTDSDIMKWKKYLSKNKYNWQNYLECSSKKITNQLNIKGFPAYIIIDKFGSIISTQNTFANALNYVDKK
jgi:hypothetical protein